VNRTVLRALAASALSAALACAAQAPAGKAAVPSSPPSRTAEQGPAWASLTPAQQSALAPLRQDWPTIDAGRKQKWLEVVQRFGSLSPAERERVQERMADWARMTPAERGRARMQFQESRTIPAQERQALWEAYQALPSDERRALAAHAAASAPSARAPAGRQEARPGAGPVAKQNVVQAPGARPPARPVAPTVVQAKPGASTTLVSRQSTPPAHNQVGLPKIAATRDFVDPATLLPVRGPQAAAVVMPAGAVPSSAAPAPAPAPAASEPEGSSPAPASS
jgi:hypothetical protein